VGVQVRFITFHVPSFQVRYIVISFQFVGVQVRLGVQVRYIVISLYNKERKWLGGPMKTINPMMAIVKDYLPLLAMLLLSGFCFQSIVQAQNP
jgi:hypothetical protein